MAATVGSGGFAKAITAFKNDSLPQLQNFNASPQQKAVLNRVVQENANLQSVEFSNLKRSESGVTIG